MFHWIDSEWASNPVNWLWAGLFVVIVALVFYKIFTKR